MLFAGWEVRMVKNCDRGLENTARGRKEFFEKRPHYIPLCLVGVCRSNLVFVKERSELNTPLQQTNEQTLTTSK